jgi:hypothetical protein
MIRPVLLIAAVAALAACTPAETETASATDATTPAAAEPAAETSADASWQAVQDRYRSMETAPADPLEALEWRAVGCGHLSGEIGGDGSERDQALNAQMEDMRCGDELVADARAMRDGQTADPAAVARLDAVLANSGA